MVGLTSSYIQAKLVASGITAATTTIILEFLNTVQDAAALAGTEPAEGPIADDPSYGWGDQVRDYDIGMTVAQRILSKRASLGGYGYTSLMQLSNINGFGPDKLNDLLYSFTTTVHELSSIDFNYHDGTCTHDALNIRENAATAAPSPSWRKGISHTYADSPVAYAIKETQGNQLGVRVRLKANGLSGAFVRALGGGRLGPVTDKWVSFDSAGTSGLETFALVQPSFHPFGVNAYNILWRWQWRRRTTDPWRELVLTRHRLFVILRAPSLPWVQTPGATFLPWTDALEIACTWASGAGDHDIAAARITERYNGCGRVSYDTVSGATAYGLASFNLSQMINRLNGGPGLGGKVNCTDSANTVSTLANLVGCDLWQSRMGWYFRLNPLIAVGYNTWAVPFNGGFSYHEVAWKGACTAIDSLFDGCLKVDGDADPTAADPHHTALLPTNLLFGDCATMNYRLRLCPPTTDGCAACQPQPATTRQRRPIL